MWLHGSVKTPPFSNAARREAGYLLRMLQNGERLAMPHARPMPQVGPRCSELRINDEKVTWRIMVRVDSDAVVILGVFEKKSGRTPKQVLETCRGRLKRYDSIE